jgi:hypothetical protein
MHTGEIDTILNSLYKKNMDKRKRAITLGIFAVLIAVFLGYIQFADELKWQKIYADWPVITANVRTVDGENRYSDSYGETNTFFDVQLSVEYSIRGKTYTATLYIPDYKKSLSDAQAAFPKNKPIKLYVNP